MKITQYIIVKHDLFPFFLIHKLVRLTEDGYEMEGKLTFKPEFVLAVISEAHANRLEEQAAEMMRARNMVMVMFRKRANANLSDAINKTRRDCHGCGKFQPTVSLTVRDAGNGCSTQLCPTCDKERKKK